MFRSCSEGRVISLSKGKAKMKNQAGFFCVCVWLATSLVARKLEDHS